MHTGVLKVLWADHNGTLKSPSKGKKIDALKVQSDEARASFAVAEQRLKSLRARDHELRKQIQAISKIGDDRRRQRQALRDAKRRGPFKQPADATTDTDESKLKSEINSEQHLQQSEQHDTSEGQNSESQKEHEDSDKSDSDDEDEAQEEIAAIEKERRQLRAKLKKAEKLCHERNVAYGHALQRHERAVWLQEFGQRVESKRADLDEANEKLRQLQEGMVQAALEGRLEEVPRRQKRVKAQTSVVHRKTQAFRRLEVKFKQARLSKGPTPGTTNTVEVRNEAIEVQLARIAKKQADKAALAAADRTWHGSPSQNRKLSYVVF